MSNFKQNMKKNTQFSIQDLHFISVVVPSLNGNYAKLLTLDKNEIKTLMDVAKSNIGQSRVIFAMFAESNMRHQINRDVMGGLTNKQFNDLLKNKYNGTPQMGGRNKKLLNVA
jgi:hypothetical protein